MRILQVNYRMNIGGIESFLMNIYRNIDREKYQFVFLTYYSDKFDFEDEIKELGGEIIRISHPNRISKIKHIKEIYQAIRKNHIDVVHCHTYFDSAYVMLAAKLAKINVRIVHSHTAFALTENNLLKHIKWKISRYLIKLFSTDNIACSEKAGKALYKDIPFTIIPNGIDLKQFLFNKDYRKMYREMFKIEASETILGHVGRFVDAKNHKFLIEIFKEYLKLNQNSRLILVGDGPLKQQIETLIKEENIQDKVILLGNRNDINKLVNALDIIVFPSIYEGLPVTLVETQANGLPAIISSSISKEVVVSKCIHFLSLEKSAEDWAQKIKILNKNRIDITNGLLESDYNIKNTIEKLVKIYNKSEQTK